MTIVSSLGTARARTLAVGIYRRHDRKLKVVNTVMIVSVEEAQRRWDELLDYVATDYEQVLIRSETAQAVLVSAKTTTQRRTGECPQLPETQAAMSAPAES